MSKPETGKQIPTEDDLDAWVTATGAGKEQATELAGLYQPGRTIEVILGEAALWNTPIFPASPGQASYVPSETALGRDGP